MTNQEAKMKTILDIAKECGAFINPKSGCITFNETYLTATIEAWNRQNSEPVGHIDDFCNFEKNLENWMIEEPNTVWKPVYLAPPQPQTVRDALEGAAKICEGRAWSHKNTAMLGPELNSLECAKLIRALIDHTEPPAS